MKWITWLLPVVMVAGIVRAVEPEAYKADAGPMKVDTLEAEWKMPPPGPPPTLGRTVPVKIFFPTNVADLEKPVPAIVFSHGLGGSREGYGYWASHWASYGYIVVLPTHVGSDTSIIKGGMTGVYGAMNLENVRKRIEDVHFVIDELESMNAGTMEGADYAKFKGKIDLKHIGMAGHSFGAQTTLAIAGEVAGIGALRKSAGDDRVTAAIAMSPQPAIGTRQDVAFGSIKIPVLHITGTKDDGPTGLSSVKAIDRRVPFDHSNDADTLLIIFDGANHMTFAPRMNGRNRLGGNDDQEAHTLTKEATMAFWDAWLKDDAQAKSWLLNDFPLVMGDRGRFETKTAAK